MCRMSQRYTEKWPLVKFISKLEISTLQEKTKSKSNAKSGIIKDYTVYVKESDDHHSD